MPCRPGALSVLNPDLYDIQPERVKTFADKRKALVTAGVDVLLKLRMTMAPGFFCKACGPIRRLDIGIGEHHISNGSNQSVITVDKLT